MPIFFDEILGLKIRPYRGGVQNRLRSHGGPGTIPAAVHREESFISRKTNL